MIGDVCEIGIWIASSPVAQLLGFWVEDTRGIGGFIGTISQPRGKRIMPDSERDPRGSSRLTVFVPVSLAGMTCGVTLSAFEEKKRITLRGGRG
jgi:hypothetical protein